MDRRSIQSVRGHDGEDSYLASLSDLIIGVLFVFIILLMAFALNYKVAQADANSEKKGLEEKNQQLTDAQGDRTVLLTDIQNSLQVSGIPVEIDTENGVLRLPEALLFDSGRAEFREGGARALKVLAENLAVILPCFTATQDKREDCVKRNPRKRRLEAIFVEGHTDNVPIRTAVFKDNWDLSVARSKTTYLELTKAAPALEGLQNGRGEPLLSFSAYAERRPLLNNETDQGRRKNRRIDLRFIMAVPVVASLGNSPAPGAGK